MLLRNPVGIHSSSEILQKKLNFIGLLLSSNKRNLCSDSDHYAKHTVSDLLLYVNKAKDNNTIAKLLDVSNTKNLIRIVCNLKDYDKNGGQQLQNINNRAQKSKNIFDEKETDISRKAEKRSSELGTEALHSKIKNTMSKKLIRNDSLSDMPVNIQKPKLENKADVRDFFMQTNESEELKKVIQNDSLNAVPETTKQSIILAQKDNNTKYIKLKIDDYSRVTLAVSKKRLTIKQKTLGNASLSLIRNEPSSKGLIEPKQHADAKKLSDSKKDESSDLLTCKSSKKKEEKKDDVCIKKQTSTAIKSDDKKEDEKVDLCKLIKKKYEKKFDIEIKKQVVCPPIKSDDKKGDVCKSLKDNEKKDDVCIKKQISAPIKCDDKKADEKIDICKLTKEYEKKDDESTKNEICPSIKTDEKKGDEKIDICKLMKKKDEKNDDVGTKKQICPPIKCDDKKGDEKIDICKLMKKKEDKNDDVGTKKQICPPIKCDDKKGDEKIDICKLMKKKEDKNDDVCTKKQICAPVKCDDKKGDEKIDFCKLIKEFEKKIDVGTKKQICSPIKSVDKENVCKKSSSLLTCKSLKKEEDICAKKKVCTPIKGGDKNVCYEPKDDSCKKSKSTKARKSVCKKGEKDRCREALLELDSIYVKRKPAEVKTQKKIEDCLPGTNASTYTSPKSLQDKKPMPITSKTIKKDSSKEVIPQCQIKKKKKCPKYNYKIRPCTRGKCKTKSCIPRGILKKEKAPKKCKSKNKCEENKKKPPTGCLK
ncbi:uncharacterized protein LOC142328317 [Lycorma delicatula]|uniref:uncharacterized protein LOC142328317 n=1 Tax=Lycorma delicatula TaxID=130591 RepID=UPI003F517247